MTATAETTEFLRPQTLVPMPAGTGPIRRIRASLQNPISMYTEDYFAEPVVKARIGGRWFAQIMDPDMVQTLLQGEGTISARSRFAQRILKPALRDGLLTAEGHLWRTQRRAASPAFRARALEALVPTFSAAGEASAARLAHQSGEIVDIASDMTHTTFDVISQVLLAEQTNQYDQADIAKDITVFVNSIGKFTLNDLFPLFENILPRRLLSPGYRRGIRAVERLRGLAVDIVRRRMKGPTGDSDLMGLLINARDPETGQGLSPEQLVDNALTFVGAGHETTAIALSWTLSILAEAPDFQDRLADEATRVLGGRPAMPDDLPALDLHDRVIRESMRLYPPVPIIPRSVIGDVEFGGHHFKSGDHVSVGIYPMHRHKALWRDPWAFDPDRFLPDEAKDYHKYQWLPFGGGPRVCIGQRFAMMEAVAILAALTPKIRVEMVEPRPPEPYLALTMRPKGGMPLRVIAR